MRRYSGHERAGGMMDRGSNAGGIARTALGWTAVFLVVGVTISGSAAPVVELVRDINPGTNGSYVSELTDVDGTLFFSARDGSHGAQLWKSDGTEAGTVMVKDIRSTGRHSSAPDWLTAVSGTLFFTAYDGLHGTELW